MVIFVFVSSEFFIYKMNTDGISIFFLNTIEYQMMIQFESSWNTIVLNKKFHTVYYSSLICHYNKKGAHFSSWINFLRFMEHWALNKKKGSLSKWNPLPPLIRGLSVIVFTFFLCFIFITKKKKKHHWELWYYDYGKRVKDRILCRRMYLHSSKKGRL